MNFFPSPGFQCGISSDNKHTQKGAANMIVSRTNSDKVYRSVVMFDICKCSRSVNIEDWFCIPSTLEQLTWQITCCKLPCGMLGWDLLVLMIKTMKYSIQQANSIFRWLEARVTQRDADGVQTWVESESSLCISIPISELIFELLNSS